MSQPAPIAIFAYRRARGLDRLLTLLQACPEFAASPVYVFSDGPKSEAAAKDVAEVRALLNRRRTPNMTVIEQPTNRGLAASIISGVNDLTERYGSAIVLEDDLRISPLTLTWLNAALRRYEEEPQVMQISAHAFDAPELKDRQDALFLPFITTWGWATWRRAWERFDPEADGWADLLGDEVLRRRFDLDGTYPYSAMLIDQMQRGIDSWGIRWNWSVFRQGGLVVYPPRSFVKNQGVDLKATHGVKSLILPMLRGLMRPYMSGLPAWPAAVGVEPQVQAAVQRAIARGRG